MTESPAWCQEKDKESVKESEVAATEVEGNQERIV